MRRVLSTTDVAISPDPANDFNEYCTMNKTLEYMAVGVPVVAFDLEETRVSAADAAVYASPNDPSGLAALVMELLDDPDRRARMGAVGRERVSGPLELGQQRDEPARRLRSGSRATRANVSGGADRYHRPGRAREGANRTSAPEELLR